MMVQREHETPFSSMVSDMHTSNTVKTKPSLITIAPTTTTTTAPTTNHSTVKIDIQPHISIHEVYTRNPTVKKSTPPSNPSPTSHSKTWVSSSSHAHLSCEKFGGIYETNRIAESMIYWSDIPSDAKYKSPYYQQSKDVTNNGHRNQQYLTFEPDLAAWNNRRYGLFYYFLLDSHEYLLL